MFLDLIDRHGHHAFSSRRTQTLEGFMRTYRSPLHKRLLTGILGAALLAACGDAEPEAEVARSAMTVTTAPVQSRPVTREITVMGTVVAWEEMPLGAEVSGLAITDVLVDEGDAVKRGQLLLKLNDTTLRAQLAQQEATIASARASLTEAQANLRRAEDLLPKGHISGQTADARRAAADTAAAQLALAEASRAETAARLAQTRIVAPDDGYVSARSAVIGQIVSSGTELFRIVRQGRLELDAEVPEAALASVRPGQIATVSAGGVAPTSGTVRDVAPSVDTRSRLGVAHIALPPDSGFRPGMFAQASIALDRDDALVVPQSSVIYRDGGAGVFVVGPDMTVRFTQVITGDRAGAFVEIPKGVKAGDQVALRGAGFLEDGDQVTVARQPETAHPLAGTEPRSK